MKSKSFSYGLIYMAIENLIRGHNCAFVYDVISKVEKYSKVEHSLKRKNQPERIYISDELRNIFVNLSRNFIVVEENSEYRKIKIHYDEKFRTKNRFNGYYITTDFIFGDLRLNQTYIENHSEDELKLMILGSKELEMHFIKMGLEID